MSADKTTVLTAITAARIAAEKAAATLPEKAAKKASAPKKAAGSTRKRLTGSSSTTAPRPTSTGTGAKPADTSGGTMSTNDDKINDILALLATTLKQDADEKAAEQAKKDEAIRNRAVIAALLTGQPVPAPAETTQSVPTTTPITPPANRSTVPTVDVTKHDSKNDSLLPEGQVVFREKGAVAVELDGKVYVEGNGLFQAFDAKVWGTKSTELAPQFQKKSSGATRVKELFLGKKKSASK